MVVFEGGKETEGGGRTRADVHLHQKEGNEKCWGVMGRRIRGGCGIRVPGGEAGKKKRKGTGRYKIFNRGGIGKNAQSVVETNNKKRIKKGGGGRGETNKDA